MSDKFSRDLASVRLNVHSLLQNKPVKTVQAYAKKFCLPVTVFAYKCESTLNVGTIARTAACFGFKKVVIVGSGKIDRRGMVGAQNYIDVSRAETVEFDSNDVVVFVEQASGAVNINSKEFSFVIKQTFRENKNLCLVFGSEAHGLPEDLLSSYPKALRVIVSQVGLIRSLNVAVCSGIVMAKVQEVLMNRIEN